MKEKLHKPTKKFNGMYEVPIPNCAALELQLKPFHFDKLLPNSGGYMYRVG